MLDYSAVLFGGNSAVRILTQDSANMGIISFVCLIVAIVGGILLYFTFLSPKNDGKYVGFLGKLYRFLNFKKMLAEFLLKVVYIITAGWITLTALGVLLFTEYGTIGSKLVTFLLTVILGNAIVRIAYELLLMVVVICRNTVEINKKTASAETRQAPQCGEASTDLPQVNSEPVQPEQNPIEK